MNVNVTVSSGFNVTATTNGASAAWVEANFYSRNNPSGFTVTGVSGAYVLSSQTGIFVTTGQTGAFGGSSANTGALTGIFYPLNNPSGFITGLNTGNFVTASQTGQFATVGGLTSTANTLQFEITALNNWSGASTGLYYPLSSNPNGYITGINTGNFVTTNQTGNFITSNQTGQFYSVSNPSGFITPSQTGVFASASNLAATGNTLQTQTLNLSSWTGLSTGLYYPLGSNPSGYLTGINTGNFVTNNQTGNLATTGYVTSNFYPLSSNPSSYLTLSSLLPITGQLTGAFYPLNNNPSGYVKSSQTGAFLTTSQTGNFYPTSNPSGYISTPTFNVVTESTTSRTLALTDAQKWIRCTNASQIIIGVPPQVSVAWANDTEIVFEQAGAGQVIFSGSGGVVINASNGASQTSVQYAVVGLKRVGADVWTLFGNL